MTIKECYEQIGADYEDVRSRLRSDLPQYLGAVGVAVKI